MSKSLKVALAFGLLLIVWPMGFTAITVASREFLPFELATLRLSIAAFFLLLFAIAKGMKPPVLRDWFFIFIAGAYGLVGYNVGLAFAARTISPAESSIVVALTPICIVIFSAVFLAEKIGWRTAIGILLGFAGAVFIGVGKPGEFHFQIGILFAFLSTTSQTALTILQKKMLDRYNAVEITIYTTVAGALFALPFGYTGFAKAAELGISHEAIVAILVVALLSSVIGYFLWAYLLTHLPASKTSSFLYLNPILVALVTWAWIGDTPELITFIGGAITLLGVAIVNIRRIRKAKEPPLPADPCA